MNLQTFVPTIEHGLFLTVEELAWPTLQAAIALGKGPIHASNLTTLLLSPYNEPLHADSRPGGPKGLDDLARALQEAVSWLTSHGLLAQFFEIDCAYYFITRRGRDVRDKEQFLDLLKEIAFNPANLHPEIRRDVWHIYSRGQFDVAVFTAFKRVEVAVEAPPVWSRT
jgi:hypothetical protein